MGVDLNIWRCRIGCYIGKIYNFRRKFLVFFFWLIKINWLIFNVEKYLLFCLILLVFCGDVEENFGFFIMNFFL